MKYQTQLGFEKGCHLSAGCTDNTSDFLSGKVWRLLSSPPLRTGLDSFPSSGSSLTSSDYSWILMNVPVYDTLYVGVVGFQCHFVHL